MSSQTSEKKQRKHISAGLLAHVDAGKTTLSEAMLFLGGNIRKIGRVDHKDAFLDTDELERARGITIFSKQARLNWKDMDITLLDTPGHVDFSAEMERTLSVLDYAVLVISGADGVQGHTETLWRLLENYRIPVFLFVNKMDQPGCDAAKLLGELKRRLDGGCMDFGQAGGIPVRDEAEAFWEELALTDEAAMEEYLETGRIEEIRICDLIQERKVFPCYFGSALKLDGVEAFLEGFARWTREPVRGADFGARVFKIGRDAQGGRLTYMKITGGSLKVKSLLTGKLRADSPEALAAAVSGEEACWKEKVDQLRLYSGEKYETAEEVTAGEICAVTGLTKTWPGEGLGCEPDGETPVLEPVLSYRVRLPKGSDVHEAYRRLRELEEEEPGLLLSWEEELNEIHARMMGEVQVEILRERILERMHLAVEFDEGNVVYRETIRRTAEGIGHFEPIRHYAEVHLLLEPLAPGSGLIFASACSEDLLDLNWQRLILTHLAEKKHRGVLTGSEITDMKITLVAGKAHVKHTEGGDFREATYRAVRQGLMQADSVLLEPMYRFRLEVPSEFTGRAMADIQRMGGRFADPEPDGEFTGLSGAAPVVTMRGYQTELAAYSRGRGRLFLKSGGYEPCHNEQEILEARGYDPVQDGHNPPGSVFCGHGAGFYVPWDQVEEHMHLERGWKPETKPKPEEDAAGADDRRGTASGKESTGRIPFGQEERELEEIFVRTYGAAGRDPLRTVKSSAGQNVQSVGQSSARQNVQSAGQSSAGQTNREEYLLVDGYNIIFAWEELKELAKDNLAGARGRLMDILSNYQGLRKNTLILVFDAYRVEGGQRRSFRYHNIHVVYTKEAETADQYIEKTVHRLGRKYQVTVATSDALEQVIILGQGAARMSAQGLWEEIKAANQELRSNHLEQMGGRGGSYLFDHLSEEDAKAVQDTRLGKRELFEPGAKKKGTREEGKTGR